MFSNSMYVKIYLFTQYLLNIVRKMPAIFVFLEVQ